MADRSFRISYLFQRSHHTKSGKEKTAKHVAKATHDAKLSLDDPHFNYRFKNRFYTFETFISEVRLNSMYPSKNVLRIKLKNMIFDTLS
jgi:hypothetical protein